MAPQNPTLAPIAEQVLETWFGPLADPGYPNANHGLWWGKSPETDERLTEQFGGALEAAGRGELRGWCDSARGTLAYIILIDQFSRNIHRGTPGMYALDTDAVTATLSMIESGQIFDLQPRERVFAYMPLMHAENVPLQRLAVLLESGSRYGGFRGGSLFDGLNLRIKLECRT